LRILFGNPVFISDAPIMDQHDKDDQTKEANGQQHECHGFFLSRVNNKKNAKQQTNVNQNNIF